MNKQKILRNCLLVLFFLVVFLLFLNNSFSYLDPDFGWHLRVGKEILANKSVPSAETYLTTLKNVTWVDHEWLSDLFVYIIFNNFGYIWLSFIFALIPCLVVFILIIHTERYFHLKPNLLFFLILILGILGIIPHSGIRIQELTVFFLACELLLFAEYFQTKNIKLLFFLPVLLFFWTNLHGGFLLGLILPFMIGAIKLAELFLAKYKEFFSLFEFSNLLKLKQIFFIFLFACISFFATLATPYGFQMYSFLTSYRSKYYLTKIVEWLPVYYYKFNVSQLAYLILFFAILIILIISKYLKINKNIKLNFSYLSVSLVMSYLAIKSRRHFPLFFVSSFPWLYYNVWIYILDGEKTLTAKFLKKISFFITLALFIPTLIYFTIITEPISDPFLGYPHTYPVNAINYIKNSPELVNKKIFNEYAWGGFLVWVWPEKKIFIDGRLPQYQLENKTFLEVYKDFFKEDMPENKLKQYNIELVLIKNLMPSKISWYEKILFTNIEENLAKRQNYLKNYLDSSEDWKLIYTDNFSSAYVLQN